VPFRPLLLALVALALFATASGLRPSSSTAASPSPRAAAEPVLVVGPHGLAQRDDPLLPPAERLPPPPGPCRSAPAALAAAGPTVSATLDRAVDTGAITPEQRDSWRASYRAARDLVSKLDGTRRRELRAVVVNLEALVRRRALTTTRMAAAFLQLERNTEFWRMRSFPTAPRPERRPCAGAAGLGGARVTFEGDPVVFQWYPGQGLQIQPLATFGKANALWRQCQPGADVAAGPCKPDELRALLDRMVALASVRGGFTTWEYGFRFGGGSPPWVSGLAQGTAIQALTRGAQQLGDTRYLDVAKSALGAFEAKPPLGVRVPSGSGRHYLIYSFNPGLRVLNGFLQALVGLKDLADATGDERARRLFVAGDRAARREIGRHDTGAWSLYAAGGSESDLGYHKLVRDFLRSLCSRTDASAYCGAAGRFDRYLHERTRVDFPRPADVRTGADAAIRFSLSKLSCVTLRIRRDGRLVHVRKFVLPRGPRLLLWKPGRAGTYGVQVQARDLLDHYTRVERTLDVKPRRKPRKHRPR